MRQQKVCNLGGIDVVNAGHPRVNIDASEVDDVEQSLSVVTDDVADRLLRVVFVGVDKGFHPLGHRLRRLLLIEGLTVDAVGKASHRQRTRRQMRQQKVCNLVVVVEQIAFGVALAWPVDLSQVTELVFATGLLPHRIE